MLTLASTTKIYAYLSAADTRKGFSGLSGIIRQEFQANPTDGSLFLFINRARDRMKLLHFADGGFWLHYRLLEAGTFEPLKASDETSCRLQLDATQLAMLLAARLRLISATKWGIRRYRDMETTDATNANCGSDEAEKR